MTEPQLVEDPVLKQRYVFHNPSPDLLVVESWVDPGGGVTPHVHPAQHERFEVLEGSAPSPSAAGRSSGAQAKSPARLITSFGLPSSWRGILAGAVLLKSYRNMAILLSPPPLVQRLLLDRLAPLGERRGFVPGRFAAVLEA